MSVYYFADYATHSTIKTNKTLIFNGQNAKINGGA